MVFYCSSFSFFEIIGVYLSLSKLIGCLINLLNGFSKIFLLFSIICLFFSIVRIYFDLEDFSRVILYCLSCGARFQNFSLSRPASTKMRYSKLNRLFGSRFLIFSLKRMPRFILSSDEVFGAVFRVLLFLSMFFFCKNQTLGIFVLAPFSS